MSVFTYAPGALHLLSFDINVKLLALPRPPSAISFCVQCTHYFLMNVPTVLYTVPSKVAQYVIQRHPDISIPHSYIWMPLQIVPYMILLNVRIVHWRFGHAKYKRASALVSQTLVMRFLCEPVCNLPVEIRASLQA